jgi:hypothetical protein
METTRFVDATRLRPGWQWQPSTAEAYIFLSPDMARLKVVPFPNRSSLEFLH